MGDHELWRKNIPEDFQGKMGEHWDDEISVAPIVWSSVAIVAAVAAAFVLCWILMGTPLNHIPETYWGFETQLSPLAEANRRRLPPTPWLQSSPEMELDAMLEEQTEHNNSYGWNDELNGLVRIPIDQAMDLVAATLEQAPASVEPTEEEPVDVEPAAEPADEAHGGTQDSGEAHETETGEAHG